MVGQVALEEEAGKATNGLGFVVADRGPAEFYEIATPHQRERWVEPVLRGEFHGAWAITEPGAGSDMEWARRHRGPGRRRVGAERREVVRHEPGRPRLLPRARRGRRRADAVRGRSGHAGPRDASGCPASCTTPTSITTRRSSCATAACPTRTACLRAATTGRRSGSSSSGCSSRPAAVARPSGRSSSRAEFALERQAFGARIAEFQGVSFQLADSLTELLAARLLTYHAAHAFDTYEDRKVVHGKVAMAKLYASETAAGSWIARSRSSAAVATWSRTPSPVSTGRSGSIGSGRGRARSSV